ncbi:hypothetical protein TSAR_011000 [Trichomalopsis sarcophagae]|uniref:Uncharacterized protein n=1 Tax=Trichomalopsis sarcophagae TaxID=543379 RepID=A0A232EJ29_9HYME|nr:hypothetical protein TSAR_011000 [Trichomalopsis sarcophagae]
MYFFKIKMKLILLTLAVFLSKTFATDSDKKTVHFKIHVPEIIKHHIHTKTVFIHVHEMKPKKQKEESHVEDWTSYNSYNYNDGTGEGRGEDYHRKKQAKIINPYDDYMPIRDDNYQPHAPINPYDDPDNQLVDELPPPNDNPLGFFGPPIDPEEIVDQRAPQIDAKAYPPPGQYAIHEEINEEPPTNDIDSYKQFHEEGYHRGMKTETGHIIQKDLKDFYDKEHDEGDYNNSDYENNSYKKYSNHGNHGHHHGNYDKEIGHEQRAGKKRADRRFFVARMVIR